MPADPDGPPRKAMQMPCALDQNLAPSASEFARHSWATRVYNRGFFLSQERQVLIKLVARNNSIGLMPLLVVILR